MKAMNSRTERVLNLSAVSVAVLGIANIFYSASFAAAATKPEYIRRAHRATEVWMAITAACFAVLIWRFIVYVRAARRE